MKFFTCCSNKTENQTVEPQLLPEQTEHPPQSPTVDKIIAESTKTDLKDSNDLNTQHEIAADSQKRPEEESSTENAETPEPEPPADVIEASEEESTAEVEDFPKEEPAAEATSEEDIAEQEQPAVVITAEPPIKMDQSAGIMDLNKLLENKKCMVLLGTGAWTCEKVSAFMDEVHSQHPEVQMIKYLGHDMNKFLLCGSIKGGLGKVQNAQGMYSIPIVCFLEQMNLVNIFAGIPMAEIEGALNALSSMPLSEPVSKEELLKAASEAGLSEHNRVRALHRDTPSMTTGLEQTISAQAYAEKLVNDWKGPGTNIMIHSAGHDRPGQGENLAYNWESTPAAACKMATNQWYDEIKDYNYGKPGFAMATGHFTQVVWKDATILGLGVSQMSNGAYLVVGRYSGEPGTVLGNMAGRFPDNVLPLR